MERLILDYLENTFLACVLFYLEKKILEVITITENIKVLPKYKVDDANKNAICEKKKNNKRKTTEQYKKELQTRNPNVEVLEEYINARTKILHKYKNCGHIANVIPDRILRGSGCEICYRKSIGERTRKDTPKYKEELISKNINVEVLEEYINANTPILHRFSCGHINKVSPSSILQGSKCLQCSNVKLGIDRRKSQSQYIDEVYKINPTIKVIGNYINANKRIQVQCSVCSYIWNPIASSLVKKNPTGCPKCAGQIITSSDFYKKFNKYGDKDIILTSDYINGSTKINGYCKKCKNNISMYPYQLVKGVRCKKCVSTENGFLLRKTHEQYVIELTNINKNIKVLGKYLVAKNQIKVQCNICNYIWEPIASSLLVGNGCPKCANKITISHEEFIEKIKNTKNKNIEILGKYVNTQTSIECKCKICGDVFLKTPHMIENGSGCKKCANKLHGINFRKSHPEFLTEVYNVNHNIEIIGEYTTSHNYIETRCLICGNIWFPSANSLLYGYGCPICANHQTISHKEFIDKINDTKNKNINIIGKYINTQTPIKCECKICGNKFYTMPYRIEIGNGCKKCADKIRGINSRKSHEDFISKVKLRNPNIEILEKYKTSHEHIKTKCLICNTIWNPTADSLLRGYGCPHCKSSKLETMTEYYLKNNNIIYRKYAKYDNLLGIGNGNLSYDFYLPTYNLLIECQGAQHERPIEHFGGKKQFIIQKIHDMRKRRYAHDHNIKLLEIWYYENNKIDKILKQTLNNLKLESVETVIPA